MGIGFMNWHRVVMRGGAYLLFLIIFLIAFWIRVQGKDNIPEGQFTGNDAYLYYIGWQTLYQIGGTCLNLICTVGFPWVEI